MRSRSFAALPECIFCDGSDEEYDAIAKEMVKAGDFSAAELGKAPSQLLVPFPPRRCRPGRREYLHLLTQKRRRWPDEQLKDPAEMHEKLKSLFQGCMEGRTMYVVPYCMGPLGSPLSRFGVEITDSPYVVLNMKLMTRMGKEVLEQMGEGPFVPGVHSVGVPLKKGEKDVPWPCNPSNRWIVHFPEEPSIWSFGSGYGGNALLGKKCFALRIASSIGKEEGWLAEHMLILGITNPEGEKKYIAAAFPKRLRQDQSRHADADSSRLENRNGRGMTSLGCDLAQMDGSMRSIPKRAISASLPALL